MTTEVIVKANHGWPVLVRQLGIGGAPGGPDMTVAPNAVGVFHVHSGQDLLIHEVQPDTTVAATDEPILQFFAWAHLRDDLNEVSRPFGQLAERLVAVLPRNPERTVALRKLLEAKDAAVRAAVFQPGAAR